jgi:hypothetical protein
LYNVIPNPFLAPNEKSQHASNRRKNNEEKEIKK